MRGIIQHNISFRHDLELWEIHLKRRPSRSKSFGINKILKRIMHHSIGQVIVLYLKSRLLEVRDAMGEVFDIKVDLGLLLEFRLNKCV